MSNLSNEQDAVVEAFRAVDPRLQVEARPLEHGTFAVVTFTTGASVVLTEAGVPIPASVMSHSERRSVVEIATLDQHDHALRNERYITVSIGDALDCHAPDPAPGSRFEIHYVGPARKVVPR